jgi:hypothetical protein
MYMSQKKDKIQWCRNKVQELLVKGYNHYEIASTLQISRPTITRDIQYLSECAKQTSKDTLMKILRSMEYST